MKNENEDKSTKLRKLAEMRMSDNQIGLSKVYRQVGSFHNGIYDEWGLVSPWSKSACNYDSDLMVIAQDWLSEDAIAKYPRELALGYDPILPTNKNLHSFLKEFFQIEFEDIYATNLFVFIKPSGISEKIPLKDLLYSAKKYTLKEIEIVNPKAIICLGSETYNTLCRAIGVDASDFKKSLDNPISYGDSLIYGVPHTGGYGTRNAGGLENVKNIWSQLGKKIFQEKEVTVKQHINKEFVLISNKDAIVNYFKSIGAPEDSDVLTKDEQEPIFLSSIWVDYELENEGAVLGNFLLRLRYDENSQIFQVQFWGRDFHEEWLNQKGSFPSEKELFASILANRINDHLNIGSLWLNLDDGSVAFVSSMIIAENSLDPVLIKLNVDALIKVLRSFYPPFKEFISSNGAQDDYENALTEITSS